MVRGGVCHVLTVTVNSGSNACYGLVAHVEQPHATTDPFLHFGHSRARTARAASQLRHGTSSLLTDVPSTALFGAQGLQLIWSISRRAAVIRQHSIYMQHVFAAFCQPAAPRSALSPHHLLLLTLPGRRSRCVQWRVQHKSVVVNVSVAGMMCGG